jgi:ElaB/YqjD/DUF883 family membrane-anchored ribosome-binding protein
MSNTEKFIHTIQSAEQKAIENTIAAVDRVQEAVNHRIQQAFETGAAIKSKAEHACDLTADRVREQPLKAVMAAGLIGAAIAYIATSVARRKTT